MAAEHSSPTQQAIDPEESLGLAAALAQLPDKQRQAVERCHLKGLSLAQVADEMASTKPGVDGLLHRGVAKLRRRLGEKREG